LKQGNLRISTAFNKKKKKVNGVRSGLFPAGLLLHLFQVTAGHRLQDVFTELLAGGAVGTTGDTWTFPQPNARIAAVYLLLIIKYH